MTPKEKAKELFEWAIKYGASKEVAKLFATRTVDEILNLDFNIKCDATERCINPVMNYWQEVKQEIERL